MDVKDYLALSLIIEAMPSLVGEFGSDGCVGIGGLLLFNSSR